MHDFVHCIKTQYLLEETRFCHRVSFLGVWCSDELNWAIDRCPGLYHYRVCTGMVHDVPGYWQNRLEFPE